MISAEELAPHYSAFRVSERLLLTGHSHQAWPDVGREGVVEAWDDAALHADEKWGRAFEKPTACATDSGSGSRRPTPSSRSTRTPSGSCSGSPPGPDLQRRRLVATSGEFHTLRRLMARLAEEELLDVVVVDARPADTLAERLAAETDDRTAAVLVSAVLFEDSRMVPGLDELASACETLTCSSWTSTTRSGSCRSPRRPRLGLGRRRRLQVPPARRGQLLLRVPPHGDELRPRFTGWYAEFAELAAEKTPGAVEYPRGGMRFAGATYDPTSHYRAARIFDFFEQQGLTPSALRENYLRQTTLLAHALGVEGPREDYGGFVAVEVRTPRRSAAASPPREY